MFPLSIHILSFKTEYLKLDPDRALEQVRYDTVIVRKLQSFLVIKSVAMLLKLG